ncbi:hypothetical protein QTH97_34560 [Variovorax sp. J22R24]|uniref:hypothetical protein n=1 Tax=Variovorax gracilis TaxID=3053502 RepID=UPI0025772007|nr:hypothetical protein [Variovorax sp. J22R24]MDM0110068.1 hypothetical protein [Variovorax sp. J22R24]
MTKVTLELTLSPGGIYQQAAKVQGSLILPRTKKMEIKMRLTAGTRLSALLAILALTGCAAQTVWNKPGGTQEDYSRTRYTCMQQSQQRVAGATVNAFGGYSTNQMVTNENMLYACMNANGWYLQEVASAPQAQAYHAQAETAPVPAAAAPRVRAPRASDKPSAEKLRELVSQLSAERDAMCASVEFALIVERMPCRNDAPTPGQLADKTKLSEVDKPSLVKLLDAQEAARRKIISATQLWGESISVPWTAAMERDVASSMVNAGNLVAGKITWGEYNKRRIEITTAYHAEYAKIVASK